MHDQNVEPGERWGYRIARHSGPLTEVLVLKAGTKRKPPRVQVRFLAEEEEGLTEWVPLGRLKAPWADAETWVASEARDTALEESFGDLSESENRATDFVLSILESLQVLTTSHYTVFEIGKASRFLDDVRVHLIDVLAGDPLASFSQDEDVLTASWSTGLSLLRRAAETYSREMLAGVAREEEHIADRAINGKYYYGGREPLWISPEGCRQGDEREQRGLTLVREWCGAPAVARHDELQSLRSEVSRLKSLLAEAEKEADRARSAAAALREQKRLRKKQGVTVDLGETGIAERLMLSVEQAAEFLAVGRGKIFELVKSGELESTKIWGSRRIPFAALKTYVESLPRRRT